MVLEEKPLLVCQEDASEQAQAFAHFDETADV